MSLCSPLSPFSREHGRKGYPGQLGCFQALSKLQQCRAAQSTTSTPEVAPLALLPTQLRHYVIAGVKRAGHELCQAHDPTVVAAQVLSADLGSTVAGALSHGSHVWV